MAEASAGFGCAPPSSSQLRCSERLMEAAAAMDAGQFEREQTAMRLNSEISQLREQIRQLQQQMSQADAQIAEAEKQKIASDQELDVMRARVEELDVMRA